MRVSSRFTGVPVALALLAAPLALACTDAPPAPPAPPAAPALAPARLAAVAGHNDPAPPTPILSVAAGGSTVSLWPYTTGDFGTRQDPINAIFTGHADPLRIRAALRALDGDRTAYGLPNALPFNCTWRDALGDEQAAYGTAEGWSGSAVQLACGDYTPMRFHVRLFRQGAATIAGAHMDLHIPNTHEHEVISWELAEQLLAIDMLRSHALAASPGHSGVITQAPFFRAIQAPVYASMPVELKALVGVTAGPNLPSDGRAVLFDMTKEVAIVPDVVEQAFTIDFDRVVPKPFCAGPSDYVLARGPLQFVGRAEVTPGGTYHREHHTSGTLSIVAVNPLTGQPMAPLMHALVSDDHLASVTPSGAMAHAHRLQQLFGADDALLASLDEKLSAGTRGQNAFGKVERCAPF